MNARPPVEATDDGLVRRGQAGDRAAFARLVERYQDRVYNACYRMCNNDADAQDLTQAAFVKALEALPRFEARSGFFTWLFRIAVNLAISHRRARRRTPVLHGIPERVAFDGRLGTDHQQPDLALERSEEHGRLASALAVLDADFRAAVILRDVEELDYATISEILDVPVGTVKSRIHRGRMLLRDALIQREGPTWSQTTPGN